MKRLALVAVLAGGCVHPLVATSQSVLTQPADSTMTIPHPLGESEQLVIEKLGSRGFPLVARRVTMAAAVLRFMGNRDFSGASTIGSVFYATITPISRTASRVQLVGKPTVGHDEACPSVDGVAPCAPVNVVSDHFVTGREEADVIRGVFAELELDATMGTAP